MKCDRRIRWVKPIVEHLIGKFSIGKTPERIELMKHLPHKPIKTLGYCRYSRGTDSYILKVRTKTNVDGETIKLPKKEIIETICHELAHLIHHEESAQHTGLTTAMYNEAMRYANA